MSDQSKDASASATQVVRMPIMQRVLDNPFLLVFIGVTVPTVFYIIWGLVEITQMPIAK